MNILAFDWETTGLPLHDSAPLEKQPRVIEFGAVLIDPSGKPLDEWSMLINPGIPLEPVITKITGLTDADLKDAPAFEDVLPELRRAFRLSQRAVAHNLSFDKRMLYFELARLKVDDFPWPEHQLCTVEATSAEWGRRAKLKEVYLQYIGKPLAQKHRALDDAKALAEVIVALGLAGK